MQNTQPEKRKTCFIIAPIGPNNSPIRRATDGLINSAIRPCLENEFKVIAPHQIDEPGSITNQVVNYLLNADLVIANLTGLNPNVMYELAVRHATGKPIVAIAENNTILPFDLHSERTIFYHDDMQGAQDLLLELKSKVQKAMSDGFPDNPIYRVTRDNIVKENLEVGDSASLILDKLDRIETRLFEIVTRESRANIVLDKMTEAATLASMSGEIPSLKGSGLARIIEWEPTDKSRSAINGKED